MSQIVPEEIEHLDFEPEKEEAKRHYGDPIRRDLYWCGEKVPASKASYLFSECTTISENRVTCVKCLQLAVSLGLNWWWDTHRKFYHSKCKPENHDCGE